MVVKAYNHVKNCQKKGGSVSAETPQGGKAKATPQVSPRDSQDDPQDGRALAFAEAATYAATTLGLLSGNKDKVVTTVTMPKSNDDGDKSSATQRSARSARHNQCGVQSKHCGMHDPKANRCTRQWTRYTMDVSHL